jgi:23S rRNA pseudouridine2605 synthase
MSSNTDPIRLNKYLALHAGLSRRAADEFIQKGRVTVNGTVAVVGARVTDQDDVRIDDEQIAAQTELQYILLNKPVSYVCSRRQQGENPTIYDLLPDNFHVLKPVGRLDRDSSGLILLTNDGDFAQQMTHPSFYKVKRYEVSLDTPLEPLHQQMINDFGVHLDDGESKLTLERQSDDRRDWIVTMSEGRNRQIRRTFAALGYMVAKLHRTDFGAYTLGHLAPGEYKDVPKL